MIDYHEKRRERATDSALAGAVLLGLAVAFGGVFAAGYLTASMRWALSDTCEKEVEIGK